MGRFDLHRYGARITLPLWIVSTLVTIALEVLNPDANDSCSEIRTVDAFWITSLILSAVFGAYVCYILIGAAVRAFGRQYISRVVIVAPASLPVQTIVCVKSSQEHLSL